MTLLERQHDVGDAPARPLLLPLAPGQGAARGRGASRASRPSSPTSRTASRPRCCWARATSPASRWACTRKARRRGAARPRPRSCCVTLLGSTPGGVRGSGGPGRAVTRGRSVVQRRGGDLRVEGGWICCCDVLLVLGTFFSRLDRFDRCADSLQVNIVTFRDLPCRMPGCWASLPTVACWISRSTTLRWSRRSVIIISILIAHIDHAQSASSSQNRNEISSRVVQRRRIDHHFA